MERHGLARSHQFIISFMEQVGDITENYDSLREIMCEEMEKKLVAQESNVKRDATALRERGELPPGFRSAIAAHLVESLPGGVRERYHEAKRCFESGNSTGGALVLGVAVELAFKEYFRRITTTDPGTRTWEQLEKDIPHSQRNLRILSVSRDVRINFHNPNKHPGRDDVLSDEDAVRAFYACSEALARIAEDSFRADAPQTA
jgi:hypothetical protein